MRFTRLIRSFLGQNERGIMRSSTRNRLANAWPGALLVLLAWGLAAPPEVGAGCGHDVVARFEPVGVGSDLKLLSFAGKTPAPAHEASRQDPGRPTPCSGVTCSGNPIPPLMPMPVQPPQGSRWAIRDFPSPIADPDSVVALVEDGQLLPVHHPGSVFHPPRSC